MLGSTVSIKREKTKAVFIVDDICCDIFTYYKNANCNEIQINDEIKI